MNRLTRRNWLSLFPAGLLALQTILSGTVPVQARSLPEIGSPVEAGAGSLPRSAFKQTGPKARSGQFRVVYAEVDNPLYAQLNQALQESGAFETLVAELSQTLNLPTDITIIFGECGTVNAFYDPERQQIVMCNELMEHFGEVFRESVSSDQELGEAIVNTTFFVFFHELGHALVDVLNLPTTGREEDAVDEFSTLLLLEAGETGEQAVLTAAHWFLLESARADQTQLPFWDEHSLDMQRFYGIACLAYGKNPDKYAVFVSEGILPEPRANRCPREYAKKSESWENLLAPHLKN